jgi:NADH:ubiquinone oxidoreductase subunit 6 (subunit J)
MILNIQIAEVTEKRLKLAPISAIIGIVLALQLETITASFETPLPLESLPENLDLAGPEWISLLMDTTTQIYGLGAILYTHYAYLLILASLILLSAMLGSIALTLSKGTGISKRQQVFQQNTRDFKKTVLKHR